MLWLTGVMQKCGWVLQSISSSYEGNFICTLGVEFYHQTIVECLFSPLHLPKMAFEDTPKARLFRPNWVTEGSPQMIVKDPGEMPGNFRRTWRDTVMWDLLIARMRVITLIGWVLNGERDRNQQFPPLVLSVAFSLSKTHSHICFCDITEPKRSHFWHQTLGLFATQHGVTQLESF